ncbi:MAG: hypothetical protein AB7O52_07625 [Planctomycetota bacterium]
MVVWLLIAAFLAGEWSPPVLGIGERQVMGQTPPAPPGPEEPKPTEPDPDLEPAPSPEERLSRAIRAHIAEVTGGTTTYAADDATLTIKYDDNIGAFAEPFGANDLKHLDYTGRSTRLRESTCCFAGNTRGSLHLPAVFDGPITVRAKVRFDLVEKAPTFLLRIHSSEEAFLATHLGVQLWQKAAKKKPRIHASPDATYRDTPQRWLDRNAPVEVKIVYDPSEKTVACFLDTRPIQTVKLDTVVPGGKVGFSWQDCKFVVHEIEIVGKLDRTWAAGRLAKFLK